MSATEPELTTQGLERTEAGLIVPTTAAEADRARKRTPIRWPFDDFKKVRRAVRWLNEQHVTVVLICTSCDKPLHISGNATMTTLKLTCDCAVRSAVQGA
jgi:hypothetical protein